MRGFWGAEGAEEQSILDLLLDSEAIAIVGTYLQFVVE